MTTALYRRYRPQDFSEVIGQEHVTEPLMQALRSGRIGHAYLFSGPRGCGKTTSARILARCLNCEQGPTPTPCGECDSCRALATGGTGSVDVIEIDAASHGGVDDARDLREKAAYGPAQSRYKVYIIDEAHMVTPQGFNALLKIVEEPPEHVKFVFATTEPEKVIGTIRSRTHHYPFRLVPPARLQDYLEELCEREGVTVEPGVLSFVVRAGGGSVRDSLSVLDQLIAGSDASGLTYAGAAALLGFTEGELLDAAVDALAAGDGAGMFRQIDRVIETGQDPRRFVEDLLERFRDLIVLAAVSQSSDPDTQISAVLRGIPEDQLMRMRQQAGAFGPGQLSYAADIVNAGLTEMTGATSPRLQLELLCARLLLPTGAGEQGYAARLDRLERRLDVGGGIAASPPSPPRRGDERRPVENTPEVSPHPPARPAGDVGQHRGRPHAEDAVEHRGTRGGEAAVGDRQKGARPEPPDTAHPRAQAPDHASAPDHPSAPDHSARASSPQPNGGERPQAAAPQEEARPTQSAPRGGVDTEMIRRNWPDVLQRIFGIRRVTWTFLSEHAQVLDYDGTRVLLGLSTSGLATTFRNGPHSEVVRQALSEALGIDTRVEGIPASDAPTARGGGRPAPPRSEPQSRPEPQPRVERRDADPRHAPDRGHDRTHQSPPHDDRPVGPRPERRGAPMPDDDRPPPSDDDVPPDEDTLPPDPRASFHEDGPAGAAGVRGRQAAPGVGGHDGDPGRAEERSGPAREQRPQPQQDVPSDGRGGGAPGLGTAGAGTIGADMAGNESTGVQTQQAEAVAAAPGADAGAEVGSERPVRPGPGGAAQAREALRAARRRHTEPTDTARPAGPPRGGDDDASEDDEDIVDAGAVGQPVIASVLGGIVIAEEEG